MTLAAQNGSTISLATNEPDDRGAKFHLGSLIAGSPMKRCTLRTRQTGTSASPTIHQRQLLFQSSNLSIFQSSNLSIFQSSNLPKDIYET